MRSFTLALLLGLGLASAAPADVTGMEPAVLAPDAAAPAGPLPEPSGEPLPARPAAPESFLDRSLKDVLQPTPKAGDVLGADGHWLNDFIAAVELTRKRHRPMLVMFTGSDWCPPCMVMRMSALDTDEFRRYAANELVLLELDFPRRKPQPDNLRAQNAFIYQKWGISGFPTLVLLGIVGNRTVIYTKFGFTPSAREVIKSIEDVLGQVPVYLR